LHFLSLPAAGKKDHMKLEGKDYYFISESEFRDKIKNDEFVEWEEVYKNHLYGTLKTEIERLWGKGMNVIFDVDVIGGMKIKKQYGSNALSIFVMPPFLKSLSADF
jgi:guanylate kinase